MIKLGQRGRDKITELEGIIIGRCQYLTGCDQYGIVPPSKDGVVKDAQWFDEARIEIIGSGVSIEDVTGEVPGGPTHRDAPR